MPDQEAIEWWTVSELAKRWRKSSDSIRRMIEAKDVKAMKCGAQYRIHIDTITAYERPAKPALSRPILKTRKPVSSYSGRSLIGKI